MRFDSALEVQAKVFREVFDFVPMAAAAGFDGLETDIFVDPVLLEESPQKTRSRRSAGKRAVEDIALGITESESGGETAKLAVLVQNRLQMKDKVIDRICAMAKDEIDVTYIGRQKPLWTQTRLNPLRLGGSVSPVTVTYAGTLGCFCRDNLTGADCVLSNNHVLADVNRVPVGTRIKQQGHLDGGLSGTDDIAELLRYVPIQFGGMPNSVDAAAARLTTHSRNEDRAGLYDASTPPLLMASLNRAGDGVSIDEGTKDRADDLPYRRQGAGRQRQQLPGQHGYRRRPLRRSDRDRDGHVASAPVLAPGGQRIGDRRRCRQPRWIAVRRFSLRRGRQPWLHGSKSYINGHGSTGRNADLATADTRVASVGRADTTATGVG